MATLEGADALTPLQRFTFEIRDRILGLDAWLEARGPDVPYGLAIVPRDAYDTNASDMFLIDDDELCIRARGYLPRERTAAIGGVLVVAPLW